MITTDIIRNFTDDEIAQIAHLHEQNIESGFLSSLGGQFLKMVYFSIQEKGVLIGLRRDKVIIGFISGVENLSAVYAEFVRKNFLKAIFYILPKVFSFKITKKLFDLVVYPFKKKTDKMKLPNAELLSIVVGAGYRGAGLADLLYKELVKDFKSQNIKDFKIIVGGNLIAAQKFYEKMGAIKSKNINIHKGENSWVYLHQIA